jgi:hypothetical protein
MTNRFDHLRKNRKLSYEEFVSGAESPKTNPPKKRPKKEEILLSISGKINREDCGKQFHLFLRRSLEEEIERHCLGSRQAIIHYLVEIGLATLKEKAEMRVEVI